MAGAQTGYDAHASAVLEYAHRFAENARLGHIGTEHLLLGLVSSGDSPAMRVLDGLGITRARVEAEMVEQSMTTQRIILSDQMASSLADAALTGARSRAAAAGRDVDTIDLLLGLVNEREGVAARVLAELGAGPAEVTAAVGGV